MTQLTYKYKGTQKHTHTQHTRMTQKHTQHTRMTQKHTHTRMTQKHTHTRMTQHTYKYKGTHTEHTYTYKGTHKHTQTQLAVQQPVYDHQKHKHIGNQYQQSGLEQGSGTTTSLSSTMRLTLQTRSATEAARARCDCMAGPVHTCECLPANWCCS